MPESITRPAYMCDPPPAPLHAVAQAIAAGETWLFAWTMQSTIAYHLLSRDCGIPNHRLLEIDRGDRITRGELAALARVWKVEPETVLLTVPEGTLLPDPPLPPPPLPDPPESDPAP